MRSSLLNLAPWAILISLGLTPRPALAAGDDASDRARAEYQKGNSAFGKGSFTTARYHYRQALELDATFDVLCNLGRTEAQLDDDVAALEHLTRCVENYPDDNELAETRGKFASLRDKVRTRMSEAEVARAEANLAAIATAEATATAPPQPEAEEPTESAAEDSTKTTASNETKPASQKQPARLPVSATLAGVGAITAGVGMGLMIHGGSKSREASTLQDGIEEDGGSCPSHTDCAALESALKASDSSHNAGVAALATGSALLAAGVITYIFWPRPKADAVAKLMRPRSFALQQTVTSTPFPEPMIDFQPRRGQLVLGVKGSF